jgi:hypothetical protein
MDKWTNKSTLATIATRNCQRLAKILSSTWLALSKPAMERLLRSQVKIQTLFKEGKTPWIISKGKSWKCITWRSSSNQKLKKRSKKDSLKSGKSLGKMIQVFIQLEAVSWWPRMITTKKFKSMSLTYASIISIQFSVSLKWKLSKPSFSLVQSFISKKAKFCTRQALTIPSFTSCFLANVSW